jgi:hypothetical protein
VKNDPNMAVARGVGVRVLTPTYAHCERGRVHFMGYGQARRVLVKHNRTTYKQPGDSLFTLKFQGFRKYDLAPI